MWKARKQEEVIRKAGQTARRYYNYYATASWGAVENYDLCVVPALWVWMARWKSIIHFVELQEKFRREKK